MAGESDESVMHKNDVLSPPADEDNNGGNVGPNGPLKKGPWTSAEDAILVEYVTKHGEGNWNAVQKHSGLARCGKSCRLRWANHLRPDLKKGAFSEEEENLIIELHAKMGNKWARMAAELPGRTDNEIKNFWNTRIKRKQRAGLPIYPPEVCLQALQDNQKPDDAPTFSINDAHYPDFVPVNSFEIPAVEFKALEMNQQLHAPPLLDVPSSSLLEQGLDFPYANQPLFSTTHHHPSKRLRRSSYFFPNSNAMHLQNDISLQIVQSFRHPSSSEPNWATKLELPSLQMPPSPLPPLESVDTLIQTPPNENAMPCNPSPRNDGLLEAVLYESQNKKCYRKNSLMDNVQETGLEAYGELLSPIGHSSSSSVFSGSTPISGNSFDEPESIETITGSKVKDEPNTFIPMHYDHKIEKRNPMIFTRPDFLLASDCFTPTNDLDSCLGKRCCRDTW